MNAFFFLSIRLIFWGNGGDMCEADACGVKRGAMQGRGRRGGAGFKKLEHQS
jgi:hypothetical protein